MAAEAGLDPASAIAAEAAARVGAPPAALRAPSEWGAARGSSSSGARVTRRLEGAGGFHRTLHLELELDVDGEAPPGGGVCRAALLQPLPSGLFADPYQLEDLARASASSSGGGANFSLHGPLDLEL